MSQIPGLRKDSTIIERYRTSPERYDHKDDRKYRRDDSEQRRETNLFHERVPKHDWRNERRASEGTRINFETSMVKTHSSSTSTSVLKKSEEKKGEEEQMRGEKRPRDNGELETEMEKERPFKRQNIDEKLKPQVDLSREEKKSQNFHQREVRLERSHSASALRPTHQAKTFFLPMKGEIYLDYIKRGVKKFEGRVYRGTCSKMQVGDFLELKDNRARKGILCEIISCDQYDSFRAMLTAKGILNMLPQLTEKSTRLTSQQLLDEAIKIYESFPGAEGVRTLGAIAIGVKFIRDI